MLACSLLRVHVTGAVRGHEAKPARAGADLSLFGLVAALGAVANVTDKPAGMPYSSFHGAAVGT